MYATFKGKIADLYNDNKQLIRRLRASNDIVNVQVQGTGANATIAVTMKNGKTILYKSNGQILLDNYD